MISSPPYSYKKKQGFTLIELLVVIAIIAILAVVVVLTLNPAQLLAQSRDVNRVSDMATLNSALNLYTADQSGAASFSLGTSTSVYISIPDNTSATCSDLGLPALPAGYSYACAGSAAFRNASSSGWVPVNFNQISSGAPFGSLPVDPVNQTSSGLYYTYSASSNQFEIAALPESQKQKQVLDAKPLISGYPDVIGNGSNLSLSPLWNPSGLVGYWPLNEGSGTVAYDQSGNGNNLTLGGMGTYLSWASGKMGGSAVQYSGISNSCASQTAGAYDNSLAGTALLNAPQTGVTVAMWTNLSYVNTVFHLQTQYGYGGCSYEGIGGCDNVAGSVSAVWMGLPTLVNRGWVFYAYAMDPVNLVQYNYINGVFVSSSTIPSQSYGTISAVNLGIYAPTCEDASAGSFDDLRIYNRVLSAAEIQEIYNAEK